jgi:hypothetical protein
MRYRRACFCLIVSLLWLGSGCGGDPLGRQAVSGTVKLDGVAVEQGRISFQPVEGGEISSGAEISGGAYTIPREDGLPPGKYRVVIHALKPGTGGLLEEGAMPGDELPPAEELIPPEWNVRSNQFIEVEPGGAGTFDFDIPAAGQT